MNAISLLLALTVIASAQDPAQGRGRGGGGGRGNAGGIQNLTMVTTAWADGGMIPSRYTQAGPEISPAIQWSAAAPNIRSFALVLFDADTVVNGSTDGTLHWLVWNIPATSTGLAQGQPDGRAETRQISASGSRYRGPGAPASGPVHHYVMDLFALDTMLDVKVRPPGPQKPNPQAVRTAVMQAMTGYIRGKAAYVRLFHRPQ